MSWERCLCDKRFSLRWLVFAWITIVLTGCGGGNIGNMSSVEQAQNNTPGHLQGDNLASPAGESEFEFNLRELINDYRRGKGLETLGYDPHLHDLAEEHSTEMERLKTLSHHGFNNRFEKSGYNRAVENVAYNHPTPEALFEGWRNSPGHNSNMLYPGISHVGISKVGAYATFFACGN